MSSSRNQAKARTVSAPEKNREHRSKTSTEIHHRPKSHKSASVSKKHKHSDQENPNGNHNSAPQLDSTTDNRHKDPEPSKVPTKGILRRKSVENTTAAGTNSAIKRGQRVFVSYQKNEILETEKRSNTIEPKLPTAGNDASNGVGETPRKSETKWSRVLAAVTPGLKNSVDTKKSTEDTPAASSTATKSTEDTSTAASGTAKKTSFADVLAEVEILRKLNSETEAGPGKDAVDSKRSYSSSRRHSTARGSLKGRRPSLSPGSAVGRRINRREQPGSSRKRSLTAATITTTTTTNTTRTDPPLVRPRETIPAGRTRISETPKNLTAAAAAVRSQPEENAKAGQEAGGGGGEADAEEVGPSPVESDVEDGDVMQEDDDESGKVVDQKLIHVLSGFLDDLPPVARKVVRIFTSSTFTGKTQDGSWKGHLRRGC